MFQNLPAEALVQVGVVILSEIFYDSIINFLKMDHNSLPILFCCILTFIDINKAKQQPAKSQGDEKDPLGYVQNIDALQEPIIIDRDDEKDFKTR